MSSISIRKLCSEFDLYVPTRDNDGALFPERFFTLIKDLLARRFGGVTEFRHTIEGDWKMGNVVFRDEIALLRVLSSEPNKSRPYFLRIKAFIEKQFVQKEILVVERKVACLFQGATGINVLEKSGIASTPWDEKEAKPAYD